MVVEAEAEAVAATRAVVSTTTAIVETIEGVAVADADGTAARIRILEERSVFLLACDACGHRWEVRGSRMDDLSGVDVADEEECPGCERALEVLRE